MERILEDFDKEKEYDQNTLYEFFFFLPSRLVFFFLGRVTSLTNFSYKDFSPYAIIESF